MSITYIEIYCLYSPYQPFIILLHSWLPFLILFQITRSIQFSAQCWYDSVMPVILILFCYFILKYFKISHIASLFLQSRCQSSCFYAYILSFNNSSSFTSLDLCFIFKNAHICGQIIYDNRAINIQCGKDCLYNKWHWEK